MFKFFRRNKSQQPMAGGGDVQPKSGKINRKEALVQYGNKLRAEIGLGPTDDDLELGTIVLTQISMSVLQSEGAIVHPESMETQEAIHGFAFASVLSVPVIAALGGGDIELDPNQLLMTTAQSIFQFFSEDSQLVVFQMGMQIFQEATAAGTASKGFLNFTDQIDKLVMGYVLTEDEQLIGGLSNRYGAFRKLISS